MEFKGVHRPQGPSRPRLPFHAWQTKADPWSAARSDFQRLTLTATHRSKSRLKWVLAVALFLPCLQPTASAQIRRPDRSGTMERGVVRGRVSDHDDRGLPGVEVTLTLASGDRRFGAVTGPSGRFEISALPPGRYQVSAQRPDRPGWTLRSDPALEFRGGTLNLDLKMFRPRVAPGLSGVPRRRPSEAVPPPEDEEVFVSSPSVRPTVPEPQDEPAEAILPGTSPEFEPLGHAGARSAPGIGTPDFVPVSDRWRIGLPPWERYELSRRGDSPYVTGRALDPYNQNLLKGDYPIFGSDWFLNVEGRSETLTEFRRLPVVGPASAARPAQPDFFSRGDQFFLLEQLQVTADLFQGYSQFKPFDLRFRVTPAVSFNYLNVEEVGLVNIDVTRGTTRGDSHASLEEAFIEVKLRETSPRFDFLSIRVGTQFFNSDFRGFIFFDNQPGARLFGNLKANKHQYNLAYFFMVEKDTNSLLNTFDSRRQHVFIANYYIQDFIKKGYTTQFSVHFNNDRPSLHFNTNDFVVRPAPIGNVVPKAVNAVYLGWTGDGHFGTLNVNHAFYQVLGQEQPNQIAGDVFGPVNSDINAQMLALELSVDRDWRRFRASFYFASGDDDLSDNRSRGFDAIVDVPFFAGGGLGLWNRQEIRLTGTAVALNQRFSLNPNLRSSKEEGQSNFVNPGIMIFNAGIDAELTPKWKASANLNFLSFVHTEPLEAVLFQSGIGRFIGTDFSLGTRYRPWLNNNIVLSGGASLLVPGGGFRDIYTSKSLISTFFELELTF